MKLPNGTSDEMIQIIEQTIHGAFDAKLPVEVAILQLLSIGVTKANLDDYKIYAGIE